MTSLRDSIYDALLAAGVGVGVAPELADEIAALCDAKIAAAVEPWAVAGQALSIAIAQFNVRYDHSRWNDAVRDFRALLAEVKP